MPIQSPEERPDLYDAFDGVDRPEDWKNTISTPEQLQRLLDAKQRDKDDGVDVYFKKELESQLGCSANERS